jgi:hypothetical protein
MRAFVKDGKLEVVMSSEAAPDATVQLSTVKPPVSNVPCVAGGSTVYLRRGTPVVDNLSDPVGRLTYDNGFVFTSLRSGDGPVALDAAAVSQLRCTRSIP